MRAAFVIALALAAAACDEASYQHVGLVAPSAGFAAVTSVATRSDLQIIVTSSRNPVFLDNATFRLLDGTNVGGSPVTWPRAGLDAQFGSTFVGPGLRRVFLFQPGFVCGPARVCAVRADIVVVDTSGARQTSSVTATMP